MERVKRYLRIALGLAGRGPSARRLRRTVAGRTVLVTGASEGIGAATARRLAGAGATVLLVARTPETLAVVRDEIVAAGGVAHAHPADLSVPEQAAQLADELLDRYGHVDIVVSNAGRSIRRSVADTADRFHDVQRTAAVNYLGPVQLLLRLLPVMRAQRSGHIVNVSTSGLGFPAGRWSSYLSSKGAFDEWLRCIGPEVRPDGVTVSTVYLGLVRTKMSAPTAHYHRMPAMSADEASIVVCRAVVHRLRWRPWWSRFGWFFAVLLPRTSESAVARWAVLADRVAMLAAFAGVGLWRPARLLRLALAARRYGSGLAAALASAPGPGGATVLVDGKGPVSRSELEAGTAACARAARQRLGVGPGDRVGVSGGSDRDLVAVLAAVGRLRADAVLLPPDLPAERVPEVLARERISALLLTPSAAALLPAARNAGLPVLEWPSGTGTGNGGSPGTGNGGSPGTGAGRSPRRARGRSGRLVVLTSGTTGVPRGVSHGLPLRLLLGPISTHLEQLPVRPGEPIAVATPLHHGYGLSYLGAGLTLGLPVVLTAGCTPEQTLALVTEHRVVALFTLPILLRRLCELPPAALAGCPPDALRAVVSGAAPLPAPLLQRAQEVFGDRIFNLYGSTEAGWAAIATPADLRAAPDTVGRAPRGVRLRVLGPSGELLPPGHLGEVSVHGWRSDGGWVHTGDLGELDPAGRLYLRGRMDELVVSGGEKVYPGPVLAALQAHPDVEEAVLEPVPDEEFGQRLRATVSPRPGHRLTEEDLREWLRGRLSRAEHPRDLLIVDELPRTATGKPRR